MPTLGEYLKARAPKTYGTHEPAQIDEAFKGYLANPETRAQAITTMRSAVPEWKEFGDEELASYWESKITAGPGQSKVEEQQQRSAASRVKSLVGSFQQVRKNAEANRALTASGRQPQSDVVDAKVDEADTELPHPSGAIPDKTPAGTFAKAGPRMPVVEDPRDFYRMVEEQGLQAIVPGKGMGAQVIAVDPRRGNQQMFALHESATQDPSRQKGFSALGYMTGTTDPMQRTQASALGQALGYVDPQGKEKDAYGFRELGSDVGADVREAAPMGFLPEKGLSKLVEWGAAGRKNLNRATGAVAEALGDTFDSDVARQWAAEDQLEARQFAGMEKDAQTFQENVDSLPQQEVARLAGQGMGRSVGEGVSMVAPTLAGTVLGPAVRPLAAGIGKVAGRVLPAGVKQGLKIAADEVGQIAQAPITGAKKAVASSTVGKVFSNQPGALAIPEEAAQLSARSAEVVKRGSLDRFEQDVASSMLGDLEPAWAKHGVKDPELRKAVLREVWEKWTSSEGRQTMSPVAADVADILQPYHRATWETWGDAAGRPYNPMHPSWGQDSALAGKDMETFNARMLEEEGKEAWKATPVDLGEAKGLPGVRALGSAREGMAPFNMKSHMEIGEDAVRSQAEKGSLPWEKASQAELDQTVADFKTMNIVDSLSRTARRRAEAQGWHLQEASNEVAQSLPKLQALYPERYQRLDTWLTKQGQQPAAVTGPHVPPNRAFTAAPAGEATNFGRDPYGNIRWNDRILSTTAQGRLKADDLRILSVAKPVPRAVSDPDVVVHLPPAFKNSGLDGMVVDRWYAQAIEEMASGSDTQRRAKEIATALDKILGQAQAKRAMTSGSPGFEWRVLLGDSSRHAMSEGLHGAKPELMDLTSLVSNATPVRPDLMARPATLGGKPILLDGMPATLGQLREAVEKYGSIRGNLVHELAAENTRAPGMGRLVEGTLALVPGGKAVTKAGNMASTVAAAPGRASAWAADQGYRAMFTRKVNGEVTQLNPKYSAGDGIRILNMLSQMTRGVDVRRAGQHTRLLMMDFSDTNAAQEILRPAIPFIKFWSSGIRGAFEVAARNPRNFTRMHDVARLMENWDQTVEGGALDPRTKRTADVWAGRPRIEQSGRETVLRWENPWQDAVDVGDAVMDTALQFQGDKNARGVGQFFGPSINRPYSILTGRDITTNRPVVPGVDEDMLKRAYPTMFGQFAAAARDGMANPVGTGAYLGMKYLSPAPVMTAPADLLARSALRLPSSTARSPGDVVSDLSRAFPNYMLGVRQNINDPVATAGQKARSQAQAMPPPNPKIEAKQIKKGKRPSKEKR